MNKEHPVIFTCLKCKSIPQIELSSLSSLFINCDCGYSQTIDINEYLIVINIHLLSYIRYVVYVINMYVIYVTKIIITSIIIINLKLWVE